MSMTRAAMELEAAADAAGRVRVELGAATAIAVPTASGRCGRLRERMQAQLDADWAVCHADAAGLEDELTELASSVRVAAHAYAASDTDLTVDAEITSIGSLGMRHNASVELSGTSRLPTWPDAPLTVAFGTSGAIADAETRTAVVAQASIGGEGSGVAQASGSVAGSAAEPVLEAGSSADEVMTAEGAGGVDAAVQASVDAAFGGSVAVSGEGTGWTR